MIHPRITPLRATLSRVSLVVGASVLGLVGCRGSSGEIDRATDLRSYLESSPDQRMAELEAAESVVVRCMREMGFSYWPYNLEKAGAVRSGATVENLESLEYRKLHGFGILEPPANPVAVDRNSSYVNALDAATEASYSEALFGVRIDPKSKKTVKNCREEAYQRILARNAKYARIEPALDTFEAKYQSSPQVRAAGERWTACMKEKGFGAQGRAEMMRGLIQRVSQGSPPLEELQNERDLAVADYLCSENDKSMLAVHRSEMERRFIADHQRELSELLLP